MKCYQHLLPVPWRIHFVSIRLLGFLCWKQVVLRVEVYQGQQFLPLVLFLFPCLISPSSSGEWELCYQFLACQASSSLSLRDSRGQLLPPRLCSSTQCSAPLFSSWLQVHFSAGWFSSVASLCAVCPSDISTEFASTESSQNV